jgi:hypothetical protein
MRLLQLNAGNPYTGIEIYLGDDRLGSGAVDGVLQGPPRSVVTGLPVLTTRMGGALVIADATYGFLCKCEPVQVGDAPQWMVVNENLRRTLGVEGLTPARGIRGEAAALGRLHARREAPQPSQRRTLWA